MKNARRGLFGFITLLACFYLLPRLSHLWGNSEDSRLQPSVSFQDVTTLASLDIYSPTFGAVVADIDNDGHEDLVVSEHNEPPILLLYRDGAFVDRSDLLPDRVLSDWHGITAVDLDNDGDKDLIIAGGGSDGLGPGEPNRLFRNLLIEKGYLAFEDITAKTGMAYQAWRTRVFLPLASPDGSKVDLYMVGLARSGCPNLYFSNKSANGEIILKPDPSLGLNQNIGTEGLNTFLDYDRDGGQDLVVIREFRPVFFERREDGYHRDDAVLQDLGDGGFIAVAAGDLNNDGYPDLYFCSYPPYVGGDNFSFNDHEIHFVIEKQQGDTADEFQFTSPDSALEFDFTQHTPNNPVTSASDIYIGRTRWQPSSRDFTVDTAWAEGRPVMDTWGTYVWKETGNRRWHVRWVYGQNPGPYKGMVLAKSVSQVETIGFEVLPPAEGEDIILINQKGLGFKKLNTISLKHDTRTRVANIIDINSDGLLDIVGICGSESGRFNGDPFALVNRGGLRFRYQTIMQNPEDDIFQADMLVDGFFNADGRPDFFFTNGNGLKPDNIGPYKLFCNTTHPRNDSIILRLWGTTSNRDAIGAEVELYASPDTFLGYRQVGMGFNRCQSTLLVHFGLGQIGDTQLVARIRWPGSDSWDERAVIKNRINDITQ